MFDLRELIIRFIDDGEIFSEIDESRNYYLSEAEIIVDKIKVRLTNEKRVASPKGFECWVDGKKIIVSSVRFENEQSLEKQLKETILTHSGWEDETKHKYINKIDEYVLKEREYMAHREFKAFAVRFDQYMSNPKHEPFPLLLSIERMKELFDGIVVNVDAGFYSVLEQIMFSINEAFQIIVQEVYQGLEKLDADEYEGSLSDSLKVRTVTWFGDEENFIRFKNYVVSRYGSLSKERIRALYPNYELFQAIQEELFTDFVKKRSFDEAYEISKEMIGEFNKKYDEILFEGFTIKDDEAIITLILSPVVKDYIVKLDDLMKGDLNEDDKGMMDDDV